MRHSAVDGKVERKEQADESIDHEANVAGNFVVKEWHKKTWKGNNWVLLNNHEQETL